MKRLTCLWAASVLFLLAAASPALAENPLPSHQVRMGYRLMSFDYSEPGLMDETGWLNGAFADLTYHTKGGWMLRGELELLGGTLDYDGQYQDGTPISRDTDDVLFGARLLVGRDYSLDDATALTAFAGVGYRAWDDTINGSGGYERNIRQVYMPVGLELTHAYDASWKTGVRGEYDLFLGGQVKSHLNQAVAGLNTLTNDQDFGKGYGLRFSLFVEKRMDAGWSMGVEPYFRYWNIDKSSTSTVTFNNQPVAYGWEPKNETTQMGLSLYVAF
ncbi:MAG: hypothetical protein AB7E47_07465 [Desulfovibrionaceae bacterium]